MSAVKIWSASIASGVGFFDSEAKENWEKVRSHLGNLTQSFHLTSLIGSGASMSGKGIYAGPSMTALVEVVKAAPEYELVLQLAGYEKDPDNIEKLLSDCERLLGLPDSPTCKTGEVTVEEDISKPNLTLALMASQRTALTSFLKEAKTKIRQRCDFLNEILPPEKLRFDLSSHEKFLRCFGRRSGRKTRLKIFTTNYDLCFEKAAGETNFVLLDGFSFTFPRRFSSLNYGLEIARKSETASDSMEPIENLAHLFKLHGSVNWSIKDGNVAMDTQPEYPCIIHPSSAKYQHAFQQPYLEMISHYLEAMRKLDQTLIVVGFGFADAHLVAPIESALASSSKFRLAIVDPEIEAKMDKGEGFYGTLKKWVERGDQRITLVNGTFTDFMNLVPELQQKSEAEQLADAVRRIAMPAKESF